MKKNDLTLYQSILTGKNRPWRKNDYSSDKYKELISLTQLETLKYQPVNELDFFPPHTPKCIYFHNIILSEAYRYFNLLNDLINEATDIEEKEYWMKLTLETKLPMLITQVKHTLEERSFILSELDPNENNKLNERSISEPSYAIFFLKTSLIWLHLEIQEIFSQHDIHKTEAQLYLEYFSEPIPSYNFIKEAPEIALPEKTKKTVEPQESAFQPIKGEVPGTRQTTVKYSFINNTDRFADVEMNLHGYGLIDSEYSFIKNKRESNNRNLAAIIQVLIDSNYFRRNILGKNTKVKNTDIRKYLENRYSCDVSQEFRKLQDEHIQSAKRKYYWLDKITPLR